MTDAITPEIIDEAMLNKQAIVAHRGEIEHRCLFLGALLKDCRDKEYWKKLGYDSFNSFLGDPEIGFKYKTVANWIMIVEKYSQGLMIPSERLSKIGTRRLQLISPVVKDDPDKWLEYAETMSKSDLTNEVRSAQGKPEMDFHSEKVAPKGSDYKKYVKECLCCVCDKGPVDPAHFPKTQKSGAGDYDVIPLCRNCHSEQHQVGVNTFFERYGNNIFDWIYGRLHKWYNDRDKESG